jgi:putative hemolysin
MSAEKFIDIEKLIASKNPRLLKWMPKFILSYLKKVLHENDVNHFILNNKENHNEHFCQAVIDHFNIKLTINGIENIPKEGSITLAINHPLGGMDAMALVCALSPVRKDIKFIVNDILLHLSSMEGMFIGVNKHGKNTDSTHVKIDSLFSSNQVVCIFPAGMVSRKIDGKIQDYAWKKTFLSQSIKHERVIIPVLIEGQLSPFFYRLFKIRSLLKIKANLEMFYLVDELFRQKDKQIKITIGNPIPHTFFDDSKSHLNWAQWVREKIYTFTT